MANKTVKQMRIASQPTRNGNQFAEDVAFFNADDTPMIISGIPTVTTATAIGTAAKTTASVEPPAGTFVAVKYTSGNSADSATVAFAGGSARAIKLGGTASLATKHTLAANGVGVYFFDGTTLNQLGVIS
jgi:hypothetical protein